MFKDTDYMVRIEQELYERLRAFADIKRKQVRQLTIQAIIEFLDRTITKEDKKLVDQIVASRLAETKNKT
jgi:hypothetical protein